MRLNLWGLNKGRTAKQTGVSEARRHERTPARSLMPRTIISSIGHTAANRARPWRHRGDLW